MRGYGRSCHPGLILLMVIVAFDVINPLPMMVAVSQPSAIYYTPHLYTKPGYSV